MPPEPILAFVLGLVGSSIPLLPAVAKWLQNRKKAIANAAAEETNLNRDLNHIKRNLEANAQAFEILKAEQEKQSKLLLKIAAKTDPNLIDEIP